MSEFVNKDNITLLIAILGFVMSLITWVKKFLTQRRKLSGKVLGIKSYEDVTFIYLLLENKSMLPISVTWIALRCGGESYPCTPLPVRIFEKVRRSRGEIIEIKREYSTPMPITIGELGAVNALVFFENLRQLPPDDATHLNLQVCTNRGKPMQMTLLLPEDWASQRNVSSSQTPSDEIL